MDEASQAPEPSVVAVVLKATQAVLIGDENQLPPVVRSEAGRAVTSAIGAASLFARLVADGMPVHNLTVQYR